MKLFTQTFLLLVFTFSFVDLASAQLPPPAAAPAKGNLTETIGKAKIYESKTKKLVESYFLNHNYTQIIQATYEVPINQVDKKPKGIQLIFYSHDENTLKYTDNHKFSITLDGKNLTQGETSIVLSICNSPNRKCSETLETPMLPLSDFQAILKAKKVQLKFGDTVFDLTPEEIEGLRDLQKTLDK